MNHEEAIGTHAVERYSLGEMTPEERDAFEHHYFECAECWAAAHHAEVFAQNAKVAVRFEARKKPRTWSWWIPQAAAAAMLLIVGIAALRVWRMGPGEGSPPSLYVRGISRSSATEPVAELPARKPVILRFQISPNREAVRYRLSVTGPRTTEWENSPQEMRDPQRLGPMPPGRYVVVVESVDRGGRRSETNRVVIDFVDFDKGR